MGSGDFGSGFDKVRIAGRLVVESRADELRQLNEPAPLELLCRDASLCVELRDTRAGDETVCRR